MTKTAPKSQPRKHRTAAEAKADLNRRREWRFDLPLRAVVEGRLPQGKKFKEEATLRDISSTGAYFCLDSGVIVGSKLHLVIEIPPQATEGQKVKLRVGGLTIRLEQPNKKKKKQGVAVRFDKDFEFLTKP
ncbi:MAG: PilZ domain-containing protein [Acidobacteriota bacterium]|nr:PilZ domain-containing protein [Acidobacteriota bacterium]